MLNFIITTIAFSLSAYILNRHFDSLVENDSHSRTMIVMVVSTLISIGAGWATDQLDGNGNLNKKT